MKDAEINQHAQHSELIREDLQYQIERFLFMVIIKDDKGASLLIARVVLVTKAREKHAR